MSDPENPKADLEAMERALDALRQRVSRLERFAPPDEAARQAARIAREAKAADWEAQLGGYWLSRLGIVSLITGTALLIITYFGQLGPFVRVALGYAIAAALAYVGRRLARSHRVFGQVLFGGGLAIGYFVTYALHFVEAIRIIDSQTAGVVLVALAIAGIVITAHRLQSETVAGIALFLALHTGLLSDVTALTLVCTTLLAAGAVFFVAQNRWVIVPLSSVVAVYSTHATWAYGGGGELGLSLGFLAVDFALFASAALIRPAGLGSRSVALLALLNWAGIVILGGVELHARAPADLFTFLAVLAVAHALLGAVAWLRRAPRALTGTYLGLAVLTLAAALPVQWEGGRLIAGWLVLGLAAMVTANRGRSEAFGWMALPILGAVLVQLWSSGLGWMAAAATSVAFLLSERLHPGRAVRSLLRAPFVAGFAAALLLLSLEAVPASLQTLGWVGAGFVAFVAGFALRDPLYRWGGFGLLALAALRLLLVDLAALSAGQRSLTFLAVGALLLVVSFVYSRLRQQRAS